MGYFRLCGKFSFPYPTSLSKFDVPAKKDFSPAKHLRISPPRSHRLYYENASPIRTSIVTPLKDVYGDSNAGILDSSN